MTNGGLMVIVTQRSSFKLGFKLSIISTAKLKLPSAVGVPEISPVLEFKASPSGSDPKRTP